MFFFFGGKTLKHTFILEFKTVFPLFFLNRDIIIIVRKNTFTEMVYPAHYYVYNSVPNE